MVVFTQATSLNTLQLDVADLIADLRVEWVRLGKDKYNPTALTQVRQVGDHIMFCCPFHDDSSPSTGMMVDYPYGWNCFGCGESGGLSSFVAKILDCNELQALQYLFRNYSSKSILDRKPLTLDWDTKQEVQNTISEEELKQYSVPHDYLLKRGLSTRTLSKYEVGYDSSMRAVTFPVRDLNGSIRFIKRRFVDRKGFLNSTGSQVRDVIYGLYYLVAGGRGVDEIYLTESEIDTMSCYQVGLPSGALLGRVLYKEQVNQLLRAGIRKVYLMLDNDAAGREGTKQAARLLLQTPIKVGMVIYPGGGKDANDLLRSKQLDKIKIAPLAPTLLDRRDIFSDR